MTDAERMAWLNAVILRNDGSSVTLHAWTDAEGTEYSVDFGDGMRGDEFSGDPGFTLVFPTLAEALDDAIHRDTARREVNTLLGEADE